MNSDACILLGGDSRWAFETFAASLSKTVAIDISSRPRWWNYVLCFEEEDASRLDSFIPLESIEIAADKRRLASVFERHAVSSPTTVLIERADQVRTFVNSHQNKKWCLKFPTSCGGAGHQIITSGAVPEAWPRPYVVQEFVEMEFPEVYRSYSAGGEIFGFVVRRYRDGANRNPWVAHARGAFYELESVIPPAAYVVAKAALNAAGLLQSFGCVDLIRRPDGEWLALEVGTDGVYNHVDRETGNHDFEQEVQRRVAGAFWNWVDRSPR